MSFTYVYVFVFSSFSNSCRLGQACSHIAALLFYIDHHISRGLNKFPSEVSKTSKPMLWNQPPRKKVTPTPIKEMDFAKAYHGQDDNQPAQQIQRQGYDGRRQEDRVLDKALRDKLVSRVKEIQPMSGLQQFWERKKDGDNCSNATAEHQELEHLVIFSCDKLTEVNRSTFGKPSLGDCQDLVEKMIISEEVKRSVELQTRGQGKSALWRNLRNARLTSSRFGEIVHRRPSTDPRTIVHSIMGYTGQLQNLPAPMRWGLQNEPLARKAYIANRREAGEDVRVDDSGLHLMETMSYIGASTDGIITSRKCGVVSRGVLEIKCPYSIKHKSVVSLTPVEIADDFGSSFFMQKTEDGLRLRTGHNYYFQVQGEINVVDVEFCDFVVFSGNAIYVERIFRDKDFWENDILPPLNVFYLKHIAPEILGGQFFNDVFPEK